MFICSDSRVCSLHVAIYHTELIVWLQPDPTERTQSLPRQICMSKQYSSMNSDIMYQLESAVLTEKNEYKQSGGENYGLCMEC